MLRFNNLVIALAFFALLPASSAGQQEVASQSRERVFLIEFTADSCPACRQMQPVLQQLANAGAPIRRVDVHRQRSVAAQFRITSLPTFVATADGREVDRQVGPTSSDRLRQMLQRAEEEVAEPTVIRGQSTDQTAVDVRDGTASSPEAVATRGGGVRDEDLIASSVRLRVEDPQGISYGTGTIISVSVDGAVVLTCGHLFRESQGNSPVQVELFAPSATSPEVVAVVEGQVMAYDLVRDLGFVRFQPPREVRASPVADRNVAQAKGERVVSVGCDFGNQPSVWHTRVTDINRYMGPANVEAAGTPVQGRSGGGLFNTQGQLIGVCFAADEPGNEGLYVGLPAIYEELDRLNLHAGGPTNAVPNLVTSEVSRGMASASPSLAEFAPGIGSENPSEHGDGARGDLGAATVPPEAVATSATSTQSAAGQLMPVAAAHATPVNEEGLSPQELAALEEIARRSEGGEVIVVIRPASPGARCEILSLDNPTQEFLDQLASLGRTATRPRFTTLKQHAATTQKRPSNSTNGDQTRRGIEGWTATKE